MNAIEPLLALLADRGHDFRDYRHEVLARRIADRMNTIGEVDLGAYTRRVAQRPEEVSALVETLLVSTSRFFRDPDTFDALERVVMPALVSGARGRILRVWVAGSAAGEEAWSLAMLLDGLCPYEIFASDASERAVARARTARYPISAIADVPARFHHHLAVQRTHVDIAEPLRARVRFSHHDLFGPRLVPSDAVLARFDLVMCRNVLIYLEARLQDRLLDRLVSVLAPSGVLGIGPYEHLTAAAARALAPIPGVIADLNLFQLRRSA
jgi:two-component system CheB/CheR fusion protein